MMKAQSFDYVILGGGCAALSLASHISDKDINSLFFFNIRKKEKNIQMIEAGASGLKKKIHLIN